MGKGAESDRKLRDYFPLEFVGLRAAVADGAGNGSKDLSCKRL